MAPAVSPLVRQKMVSTRQETPALLTKHLKIRKPFGVPSETSSTNSQLPAQPPSPEPLGHVPQAFSRCQAGQRWQRGQV